MLLLLSLSSSAQIYIYSLNNILMNVKLKILLKIIDQTDAQHVLDCTVGKPGENTYTTCLY